MIVIETDRIYLRCYKEDDFEGLHAIFSDPETMANYPAPFTIQETQNWIKRNEARYKNDGFGLWGVCLKATDELIGDCGLVKQTIDGTIEVEIGYHISVHSCCRENRLCQRKRSFYFQQKSYYLCRFPHLIFTDVFHFNSIYSSIKT